MNCLCLRLLFIALVIVVFFTVNQSSTYAQGGDDLRAKVQNPVASMISLPFKNTFDFGAPNGSAYFLNIQPVIPFTVGPVNFINRVIVPFISVDGLIAGTPNIPEGTRGDRATGLGDINYSLFLSPAAAGKVTWGIGPSITFPTATNDQLGTGKWSAGPTAVVLTQPKPWTLGALARQLWSFAGDSDRVEVNQFLLEPFINYNLQRGWYLITDMIITANWDADSSNRWTVPLGGWSWQAVYYRKTTDQYENRSVLQRRETRKRARLVTGFHASIPIPEITV